jgi:uncharacterized repeat protein (TIGR01451 family)
LGWIKNNGGQSFTNMGIVFSGTYLAGFLLRDVDNDGVVDILLKEQFQNFHLIKGEGYGMLSEPVILTNEFSGNAFSFYAEDMDSDGDIDILIDNYVHEIMEKDLYKFENNTIGSNEISGKVFYDLNRNQQFDSNEVALKDVRLNLASGVSTFSGYNGHFRLNTSLNSEILTPIIPENWTLSTDSSNFTIMFSELNTLQDSLLFGMFPDSLNYDASTEMEGGFPRCNTISNLWLTIKNTGTFPLSGRVEVILDDSLTFVSSQITPDSSSQNRFYWHYDSLPIFASKSFNIRVLLPDFQSQNDTIFTRLNNTLLDSNNLVVKTLQDTLKQVIVCAYDPNDKIVKPSGLEEFGYIMNNQHLEYTIRFQNTGTDTAINIKIIDKIHDNLDLSSLEILASSHAMTTHISSNRGITFQFDDIFLPDSTTDFNASQGYVKYRIAMNPNLNHGEQILNVGSIYFDFNPPIVTNTTLNTIYNCNALNYTGIFSEIQSTPICDGVPINLSSSEPEWDTIKWYLNGNILSITDSLNFSPSYPLDTIRYTAENPFCSQDTSIILSIYESYVANLSMNDSLNSCNGDTVVLNSNFTSENMWLFNGQSFSTETIVNVTQTGNYILNINQNNCVFPDSVFIYFHEVPAPIISDEDSLNLCENQELILFSNDLTNENMWYYNNSMISTEDSIVANQSGLYTLVTTNDFCGPSGRDSVQIFIHNPIATFEILDSYSAQSVDTFNTYLWLDCNNMMNAISGENNMIFTPNISGNYALMVSNTYGCQDTSSCFTLDFVGLSKTIDINNIYPNPVSDYLYIVGLDEMTEITIFDSYGRKVLSEKTLFEISMKNLVDGTYFICFNLNGQQINHKIILLK